MPIPGVGRRRSNTPDRLTVTYPQAYQVYQRDGSDQADIAIGGYLASGTGVEARWSGGSWVTIARGVGYFTGSITGQSAGQGTLEVRPLLDPGDTNKQSVAYVGIGDVFWVAGQSNAEGALTNNQSYSHGSLKAGVFDKDHAWRELTDPSSSTSVNGSVWPLLATLHMAAEGVPVAFITTAEGGKGLVTPDNDWAQGSATYEAAEAAVDAAIALGLNDVKAILWNQGERDVVNSISQAAYQTALSQMLDDLQSDTGLTSPMVCAMVAQYESQADADMDAIRAAHVNRWDNDADIYPGPTGHDQDFADSVHWTTNAEAQTLANRWWRTIDAALYGGAEAARGPKFSSATRTGTTVTVTFTGGEGNLANQTDETGFVFTDDGTPIAITGAAGNGTDAVDLTLGSTPSGTELVSFCSGDTGKGGTLQDSGTYSLPPEPFVDESVT